MSQLLLSYFCRNSEVVQERRMDVPELVPCHAAKPRSLGSGSEYPSQLVSSVQWTPLPIRKNEVFRFEPDRTLAVGFEQPACDRSDRNYSTPLFGPGTLNRALKNRCFDPECASF
jgi:hypothetical protein